MTTATAASILIVDDELQNRKLLEALLLPEGYITRCAANGEEALASIAQNPPDLVLLDIMMPGMDGFEVASQLKASPATASIPLIMVSAQGGRGARVIGLNAGAEDFLTKPVDRAELWLRVRNLLRLKAYSDLLQNHSAILEKEVRARVADLHRLANYNPLTGLPNRALFHDILKKTLTLAADQGNAVAVLCIGLENFKNINDTLGHEQADEFLCQFSGRLAQCVRVRDTVGHLDGAKFAMIMVAKDVQKDAPVAANLIREALHAPFCLAGHEVVATVCIGISVHPKDACDEKTLINYADTAMARAKQAGPGSLRFFTAQMNTELLDQFELEAALRKAVEKEEFVLHYQPKVHLASGRIVGVEALLRWERPGHGLVLPGDFIDVLETTGLIVRVGQWAIAEACRQIGLWAHSPIGPVPVSVNVSGPQFNTGDLEADVAKAINDNAIAPELLELELTESTLMVNTERTIVILHNLRKRGVRISIDDFGTGYSSLAYLRHFPVDKLKIDIAFVRGIASNAEDAAIALTIIKMAHGLKLDVIAEGVETAEQLAYMHQHGCDQIQGFLVSPGLAPDALEKMLRERKCLLLPANEAGSTPLASID